MPSEKLTDKYIRALQPPEKGRLEIWDSGESGLILRVSAGGTKSWAFQYKSDKYDGSGRRRTRRLTFGRYGSGGELISLKDARRLTQKAKALVADGADPAEASIEARQQAIEDGRRRNVETVSGAVEAFCAEFENDPSAWKAYERPRILRRELAGRFGEKGIGEVTFADLSSQQKAIRKRAPVLANRFAEAVRIFYKWAAREYDVESPAENLGRVVDEDQFRRDRYLTITELRTVWDACGTLSPVSRDFIRFLMLTPQRIGAVAAMRFHQVNDDAIWTVPRLSKKQKKTAQALPLSDVGLSIIERRRTEIKGDAFVFSSGRAGDRPPQSWSQIKTRLDKTLSDEFEAWRFHDFRRSFSTWAAANGIDQIIVRKILDHGQGHRDPLDAIYNRHQYLDEQRHALNLYARAINNE